MLCDILTVKTVKRRTRTVDKKRALVHIICIVLCVVSDQSISVQIIHLSLKNL